MLISKVNQSKTQHDQQGSLSCKKDVLFHIKDESSEMEDHHFRLFFWIQKVKVNFLEIRILLSMSLILYWSQPINNQCCVWISAGGSYYDCKIPFSYNHQGALKKKKAYYLQDLEITQCTWGHTVWLWAERESAWPLVLLLLASEMGAQGFSGSLFL